MMGFIAGLLAGAAGAMGLGGGSVLLIYLTLMAGTPQLEAQGINLVFFLPCAVVALLFHLKSGLLKRRTLPCILTGLLGAALGTFLAGSVGEVLLRKLFAALLLLLGGREIFAKSAKGASQTGKEAAQSTAPAATHGDGLTPPERLDRRR
ncbi:MAG: TSUP family transporter [Candidatus Howiella sp.]|jgi:uncharacterized membrane protein YfcA